MPILKFYTLPTGQVTLENLRLEDITHDKRTSLINKQSFLKEEYKVENNVYVALNDTFFRISKFFNRSGTVISAMLLKEGENQIIIVPSRSYVFWKGRSIEPAEYRIIDSFSDQNIFQILRAVA